MKTLKYRLLLCISLILVFISSGCSNPLQTGSAEKVQTSKPAIVHPKDKSSNQGEGHVKQTAGTENAAKKAETAAPSPAKNADTGAASPVRTAVDGTIQNGQYMNKQLKFALPIPQEWNGALTVEKATWNSDADETIDFYYTFPNSTIKQNIFSIFVFNKAISQQEWDNDYPIWHYIDSKNGVTYGYSTPEEPSQELFDPSNSDKLELMQKMVYHDLPAMIQSFRILPN
jgi:hypothetical protein